MNLANHSPPFPNMPLLDQPQNENQHFDLKEMSFIDHLEELRKHILRSVGAMLFFTVAAYVYVGEIFRYIILAPSRPDFITYRWLCQLGDLMNTDGLCVQEMKFQLQSRQMSEQFTMALVTALIAGVVITFPYIIWELWRFIKPGLKPREQQLTRGAVAIVSLLFFLGILFGYFVVSPLAINFLVSFQIDPSIKNIFDISSYISTLAILTLACGLTFQLPVVVMVLSNMGILTPKYMREYRKHSYVIILIIAAIITPSPDVFSQIIVATPIVLLYEISISLSKRIEKRKKTII